MQFRTEIPLAKYDFPIDYQSEILLLGSCFAENMAEKFSYFKFRHVVNPFGILFNPVSLEKVLYRSIHKKYYTESDIFYHNELWHCFEVHSDLSHPDKEEFLKKLNQIVEDTCHYITTATHIVITLGTSWIYRHKDTAEIVANCHKVPQKEFSKELLSISRIQQSLSAIISMVQVVNSNAKFIFTVSPVRHSKDGFVANNVSKAHLLAAVYSTVAAIVAYFPSYEIVLDELRDYRFYKEDMLHPNAIAIDYIWVKFFESFVNEKEFATMQQVCDIQKALQHRSFHPHSNAHQKFLNNLKKKQDAIRKLLPHIEF